MDAEANRRSAIAVFDDGWSRGDFGRLEAILAPVISLHINGATRTTDFEDVKRIITGWRAGFPDLRFQIHQVVAEEDTVAMRATLTGTHQGEWSGLAPTGRRIEVEHMFLLRFDGGLLAEVWEVADVTALRRQLTE